jgi:hypothetical protein
MSVQHECRDFILDFIIVYCMSDLRADMRYRGVGA